jgi:hypothetical protein
MMVKTKTNLIQTSKTLELSNTTKGGKPNGLRRPPVEFLYPNAYADYHQR